MELGRRGPVFVLSRLGHLVREHNDDIHAGAATGRACGAAGGSVTAGVTRVYAARGAHAWSAKPAGEHGGRWGRAADRADARMAQSDQWCCGVPTPARERVQLYKQQWSEY